MAIDIDKFKRFVDFISNKNGRGTITPPDFNLAAESALKEWTMKQYNNEEEYQPGRPIPRYSYEMTTKITDNLRHLKEVREFAPDDGSINVPNGTTVTDVNKQVCPAYLHFSSMRAIYKVYEGTTDNNICGYSPTDKENRPVKEYENDVKLVRDDELGDYLGSSIIYPSVSDPICTLYSSTVQIFPKKGIHRVKFTYLRQPNIPKWSYTVVNNRPVYDASNSVDIDAPEEAFNKIAMGALSFLGISIREPELVQYSEGMKSKGV